MEIALIHLLSSLLSTLVTTIGMIWATVISTQAKRSPPGVPQDQTTTNTAPPVIAVHSAHNNTARRTRSRLALLFIVWGQLSIAAGQWLDSGAELTPWSFSFIGQGLVMLLLGFWLLLRD